MSLHNKIRYLCCLLILALFVSCVASAQTVPPRLSIVAAQTTVPAYDTLRGVVASPISTDGKRSGTSTLIWSSSPPKALSILAVDKYWQKVSIAAESPGIRYAVVTWIRSDRLVLRDSVLITVGPPTTMILPFNTFAQGGWDFDPSRLPDYCLYPLEIDKRGGLHTGRAVTWSTGDTLWARLLNSSQCPDTSSLPQLVIFKPTTP